MIDLLKSHHRTLSTLLEEMPPQISRQGIWGDAEGRGAAIAIGIYKHILQDGIAILESIIEYLARS